MADLLFRLEIPREEFDSGVMIRLAMLANSTPFRDYPARTLRVRSIDMRALDERCCRVEFHVQHEPDGIPYPYSAGPPIWFRFDDQVDFNAEPLLAAAVRVVRIKHPDRYKLRTERRVVDGWNDCPVPAPIEPTLFIEYDGEEYEVLERPLTDSRAWRAQSVRTKEPVILDLSELRRADVAAQQNVKPKPFPLHLTADTAALQASLADFSERCREIRDRYLEQHPEIAARLEVEKSPCPACKGSGEYVGLTAKEQCAECGGSGTAGSPDSAPIIG